MELRDVLDAEFRGPENLCPYGEPPDISSSDGNKIEVDKGNWLVNGKERDVYKPTCAWIVSSFDACDGCPKNPKRQRPEEPSEISARLRYMFQIEALQSAGAIFQVGDLPAADWRLLLLIKAERQRRELERLKAAGSRR